MPDTTRAGRLSRSTWWIPSHEQSVGVPSTAYQRGLTSRIRSGRWIEMACDDALCSVSGATTQTSPSSPIAPASALMPSDWWPSSFDTRIRGRSGDMNAHANPASAAGAVAACVHVRRIQSGKRTARVLPGDGEAGGPEPVKLRNRLGLLELGLRAA